MRNSSAGLNCDSRLSMLRSTDSKLGFGVNTPSGVEDLLDVSDVVVDLIFRLKLKGCRERIGSDGKMIWLDLSWTDPLFVSSSVASLGVGLNLEFSDMN